MPGQSIGISLLNGYPGSFARNSDCIIAGKIATADIHFGAVAVVGTDNKVTAFGATDTLANFLGIAVREVKQATDYYPVAGKYKVGEVADILERGSVSVVCVEGAPTPLAGVWVCTSAGTNTVVGSIVATATPAGTPSVIALTNCRWGSASIDTNNIAELVIVARNNA
jgi:hypothetical protein